MSQFMLWANVIGHKLTPLKPSGHYMYHQFNINKSHVLPTQCGSENKQ